MIYKYFNEFVDDICKHHDCTLLITKNLEAFLTRKPRDEQNEIKQMLKRRNIKLELFRQPSDNWSKDWNWTGIGGKKK